MSDKPENPSAFPSEGEGHGNPKYHSPGMSLRDWFAGQALAGIMTQTLGTGIGVAPLVAEAAYKAADAMLLERGKDQP